MLGILKCKTLKRTTTCYAPLDASNLDIRSLCSGIREPEMGPLIVDTYIEVCVSISGSPKLPH